jgi:hypothetical protein
MAEAWEREQPCQDAHERDRLSRVFLTDTHRVGVHTPPGDVATYSLIEARRLQQDITSAVLELTRRGRAELR